MSLILLRATVILSLFELLIDEFKKLLQFF